MIRFQLYRTGDLSDTHNPSLVNPAAEPQLEGVIFTDGNCVVRWRTEHKSTSVWNSFATFLRVHGHPEGRYGTTIEFLDSGFVSDSLGGMFVFTDTRYTLSETYALREPFPDTFDVPEPLETIRNPYHRKVEPKSWESEGEYPIQTFTTGVQSIPTEDKVVLKESAPPKTITEIVLGPLDLEVLRSEIIRDIEYELDQAYAKHGDTPWSRHEFYGVVKEEVDEMWDDIKSDADPAILRIEIIQVAAMCIRFLETYKPFIELHGFAVEE